MLQISLSAWIAGGVCIFGSAAHEWQHRKSKLEYLAVRLNGESKSLEFTFTALNGGRQTVVFSPLGFLFNDQWHRVFLEISRDSVALFVDCVLIDSQDIPPRLEVSLNGFTLIGKLKDNPVVAVPVCLF